MSTMALSPAAWTFGMERTSLPRSRSTPLSCTRRRRMRLFNNMDSHTQTRYLFYIPWRDSVMTHFPHYWPFMRGIHRHSVVSLTKASYAVLCCFLCFFFKANPPVALQRPPIMWSFDDLFVTGLKKSLNKHSICRWFETPWRSCVATVMKYICCYVCYVFFVLLG